jgi:hypothetical protein
MTKPVIVMLAGLAACIPGSAHHSIAAEFDLKKPVVLHGVVTKVEWSNPHVIFWIAVKGEQKSPANWSCEAAGIHFLERQGWKRDSLKVGDQITVDGFLARDGSETASARLVRLPDGHKLLSNITAEPGR